MKEATLPQLLHRFSTTGWLTNAMLRITLLSPTAIRGVCSSGTWRQRRRGQSTDSRCRISLALRCWYS